MGGGDVKVVGITKIFDKIYTCNLVCGLELPFLTYFVKTPMKIAFFYDIYLFFVYIVSDCEYFQNFEGALTL